MRIALMGMIFIATSAAWAATGTAELRGTAPASAIKGTVHLTDTPQGLQVNTQIINLTPGLHGFHIHEFGDCSDLGKAAGSHYNPLGSPHGMVMKDGAQHAHAGDMGNIQANAKGEATLNVVLAGVTLAEGPHTIAGRALIIHEKNDDFSQPVGNAGGRVACAPILITGN